MSTPRSSALYLNKPPSVLRGKLASQDGDGVRGWLHSSAGSAGGGNSRAAASPVPAASVSSSSLSRACSRRHALTAALHKGGLAEGE